MKNLLVVRSHDIEWYFASKNQQQRGLEYDSEVLSFITSSHYSPDRDVEVSTFCFKWNFHRTCNYSDHPDPPPLQCDNLTIKSNKKRNFEDGEEMQVLYGFQQQTSQDQLL
jgi:hypothetical protein